MGERKDGNMFAELDQVERGKPLSLSHVRDKCRHESEHDQRMGEPPVEGLPEKLSVEDYLGDEDPEMPPRSIPESVPHPS